MQPNDSYVKQVGGEHYGNKYGHWDYCKEANVGYLEGSATKYIYRHKLKSGIEDLRKAASFVSKLMVGNVLTKRETLPHDSRLERFFVENDVHSVERIIIKRIFLWRDYNDLIEAYSLINDLILDEKERNGL
jgi:hypothetical protein